MRIHSDHDKPQLLWSRAGIIFDQLSRAAKISLSVSSLIPSKSAASSKGELEAALGIAPRNALNPSALRSADLSTPSCYSRLRHCLAYGAGQIPKL